MSRQKHFQPHWKELLAAEGHPKRDKNPTETGGTADTEPESEAATTLPGEIIDRTKGEAPQGPSLLQTVRANLNQYRYYWLAGCLTALGSCFLISLSPDGRQDRVRVAGQVLLNGKPLTRGTVVFVPDKGRGSIGELDAFGRFALTCYDGRDGAVPGTHHVEIAEAEDPSQATEPWPVPAKYSRWDSSGLTVEVAKTTKDLVIELVSNQQPISEESRLLVPEG